MIARDMRKKDRKIERQRERKNNDTCEEDNNGKR